MYRVMPALSLFKGNFAFVNGLKRVISGRPFLFSFYGYYCRCMRAGLCCTWNYAEADYQTASNYNININKSKTFTLETGADNYVYLTGHIYEDDSGITSTDDDLGVACKKLYLADLMSGSVSLNFNGDGDSATANFTIVPND